MKKLFLLGLIGILSSMVAFGVTINATDSKINEVAWQDPFNPTRYFEGYIELYNPTDTNFSLDDYYVSDGDDFVYNLSGFTIPPYSHFLIADFSPNGITPDYDTITNPGTKMDNTGTIKDVGVNLDEQGDDVFLYRGSPFEAGTETIDVIAYNKTKTGWEVEPENQEGSKMVFTGPNDNVYGSFERVWPTQDDNTNGDWGLLGVNQSIPATTDTRFFTNFDGDFNLSDWDEQSGNYGYFTDPTNPDTDGGGVDDGTEIHIDFTGPNNPDDDVGRK